MCRQSFFVTKCNQAKIYALSYFIDFKYSRNQCQVSLLSKAFVLMGKEKEQEEGGQ